MVLYKCDKCFKEYTKKHNYESHLKRKNPCNNNIDKDLLIKTLSDENIELKNEIKIAEELKNEMKFIKKETNIIKDNNIILKKEIKVLEEEKNIIEERKIFEGTNINTWA